MTRRGFLGLASAAGAALLSGCSWGSPAPFRYRITIDVETPSGLKTGSSVREVVFHSKPDRGAFGRAERGEAVAVDIAPGQILFALISGDGDDFYAAFPQTLQKHSERSQIEPVEIWPNPPTNVRENQRRASIPQLVYFQDLEVPQSIREVAADDLASSFGPGIALKRITVAACQRCDVTDIMPAKLSWWNKYRHLRLDGRPADVSIFDTEDSLASMHLGAFKKEIGK